MSLISSHPNHHADPNPRTALTLTLTLTLTPGRLARITTTSGTNGVTAHGTTGNSGNNPGNSGNNPGNAGPRRVTVTHPSLAAPSLAAAPPLEPAATSLTSRRGEESPGQWAEARSAGRRRHDPSDLTHYRHENESSTTGTVGNAPSRLDRPRRQAAPLGLPPRVDTGVPASSVRRDGQFLAFEVTPTL